MRLETLICSPNSAASCLCNGACGRCRRRRCSSEQIFGYKQRVAICSKFRLFFESSSCCCKNFTQEFLNYGGLGSSSSSWFFCCHLRMKKAFAAARAQEQLQLFSQHVALHAVALSFSLVAAVAGYRLCVSRCLLRVE